MITFLSPIHFHSCVMVYGFFRLCVDFDFTIVRFVVWNVMNLNVLCIECLFSLHRSEIVDLTKQNEQKIRFMCCNFGDVLYADAKMFGYGKNDSHRTTNNTRVQSLSYREKEI